MELKNKTARDSLYSASKFSNAAGGNGEEACCGTLKDDDMMMSINGVHFQYAVFEREDMSGVHR